MYVYTLAKFNTLLPIYVPLCVKYKYLYERMKYSLDYD